MAATRVIPALDEFKDRQAGFDLGFEVTAVEQFAFESGKEALAHGVVEAIAHRTHRRPHTCRLTALAKSQRSILGEFKRSLQHFEMESCDDHSKAPFRSMRASTVAVAGPAFGS